MPSLLERIPEPPLMDDPEQARAYAEADFSEPHEAFVAHFRRLFPGLAPSRATDLGCGPADVTQRFSRAYPDCRILGVDGAEAMLQPGREALAGSPLAGRIELSCRYLPDASLPAHAFDAVISNSLLHHLDDPAVLWQTVAQVGKPGAALLAMDLMRPASREEAEALTRRYAGGAPPVLQRDFFNSLLASYRPDEVRAQLEAAGLARLAVEAVSDRHLLVWGTLDV